MIITNNKNNYYFFKDDHNFNYNDHNNFDNIII